MSHIGNINPNYHVNPLDEWERDYAMGIKGYKFYPTDHGFDPNSDIMNAVYARCEDAGQPIMFHTGLTGQRDTQQEYIKPSDYLPLVKKHPRLVVILSHGGKPHWYDEALEMACEFPNVYLDTGLVPPAHLCDWLMKYPDVYQKVLFGSDTPVCGNYSEMLGRLLEVDIDEDKLRAILHDNAYRLLSS